MVLDFALNSVTSRFSYCSDCWTCIHFHHIIKFIKWFCSTWSHAVDTWRVCTLKLVNTRHSPPLTSVDRDVSLSARQSAGSGLLSGRNCRVVADNIKRISFSSVRPHVYHCFAVIFDQSTRLIDGGARIDPELIELIHQIQSSSPVVDAEPTDGSWRVVTWPAELLVTGTGLAVWTGCSMCDAECTRERRSVSQSSVLLFDVTIHYGFDLKKCLFMLSDNNALFNNNAISQLAQSIK